MKLKPPIKIFAKHGINSNIGYIETDCGPWHYLGKMINSNIGYIETNSIHFPLMPLYGLIVI